MSSMCWLGIHFPPACYALFILALHFVSVSVGYHQALEEVTAMVQALTFLPF